MDAETFGKWQRYLGRRGIRIVENADNYLDDFAEAKYDPVKKTIYLRANPTKPAFFEEAFHSLQDLHCMPGTMEFRGQVIDAWEWEAQRALIRHRHRLGIPNDQTRQTIDNLRDVYRGDYP